MEVGGRMSGRKDRERGQIGVRRIEGWEGWIRGPDALREYAVEPVGVERISPSAYSWGLATAKGRIRGVLLGGEEDNGFGEEDSVYRDIEECQVR
jgi:hypothetical protein